ncbi:hypothetical protein A2U01_0079527, partial [Trifolium medium]|nr:hypothetical protein [Trifolium medium]
AELVNMIARLSHDFVEGTEYAFNNAVQQIKFLNPDVNFITDGMHVNGIIEDDRIVIPSALVSDDEEDNVNEEDHGVEHDEQDVGREE